MFGELNDNEIEVLLSNQVIGRLGCHHGGTTYIVPISYAYDGVYIYAHTTEGMKINMMRGNPSVCFQVDDTTNTANWKSVICWGTFEELPAEKDRLKALTKLNARILPIASSETMHITPHWPFPEDSTEAIEGLFFRIRVAHKTGRFEKMDTVKSR